MSRFLELVSIPPFFPPPSMSNSAARTDRHGGGRGPGCGGGVVRKNLLPEFHRHGRGEREWRNAPPPYLMPRKAGSHTSHERALVLFLLFVTMDALFTSRGTKPWHFREYLYLWRNRDNEKKEI